MTYDPLHALVLFLFDCILLGFGQLVDNRCHYYYLDFISYRMLRFHLNKSDWLTTKPNWKRNYKVKSWVLRWIY